MKLSQFDGMNRQELAMIDVAYAILEENNEVLAFDRLLALVQDYLGLSSEEVKGRIARFYTDLNIDGRFISLGENRWALRTWYPIDAIDEEIVSSIDDDDLKKQRRRKRKKVNPFADDIIDYNDDDPEDDDLIDDDADDDDDDEVIDPVIDPVAEEDDEDDETAELKAYESDLTELATDDEEDLELDIEDQLTVVDEEDLEEDLDEDDF